MTPPTPPPPTKYELTNLHLYKSYGSPQYRLRVTFKDSINEIALNIDGSLGEEILALCRDRLAEEMARTAKESINNLLGVPTKYEEIEDATHPDSQSNANTNVNRPDSDPSL